MFFPITFGTYFRIAGYLLFRLSIESFDFSSIFYMYLFLYAPDKLFYHGSSTVSKDWFGNVLNAFGGRFGSFFPSTKVPVDRV